jgi:hypothetical protein
VDDVMAWRDPSVALVLSEVEWIRMTTWERPTKKRGMTERSRWMPDDQCRAGRKRERCLPTPAGMTNTDGLLMTSGGRGWMLDDGYWA